jgi:hypothetical protein
VIATAFGIGAFIDVDSDEPSTWWFDEMGVVAYRAFWCLRAATASPQEAAGILLWGIGGDGLILFAFEDFFGVHERVGHELESRFGASGFTNSMDEVIVILYGLAGLTFLYVFRAEIVANRQSSTLLLVGALFAVVMILTDAFATSRPVKAVELPAPALAVASFLLAFLLRYRELRVAAPPVQS